MKKLLLTALSGIMLVNGVASANGLDLDPKFYVGGEVQGIVGEVADKATVKYKDGEQGQVPFYDIVKKNLKSSGGSFLLGARLNENVAVEAGITGMAASRHTVNIKNFRFMGDTLKTTSKLTAHNLHVDVLGIVPVSDQVELIGSVGAGHLTSKLTQEIAYRLPAFGYSDNDTGSSRSSKVGVRAGIGAAYKFDENISARLMLRHQQGNKHIKNINSASLGLIYQF